MRSTVRIVARGGVAVVVATASVLGSQLHADAAGSGTAATPSKLSASGQTTSHHARTVLQWHEPSSHLRGVRIWRNTRDSMTGATRLIASTRRHSYVDADSRPGRTYWYFLRAYDTQGRASAVASLPVVTARSSTDRVLAGRVTDGTGAPLRHVAVIVTNGTKHGYALRTNSDGLFALHRIAQPKHTVAVCFQPSGNRQGGAYKYGYLPGCAHAGHVYTSGTRTHWTLAPGHYRSKTTALRAASAITGIISGGRAQVELISDTFDDGTAEYTQKETNADGSYSFVGLPPGYYLVAAYPNSSSRAAQIWQAPHRSSYFDGNTEPTGTTYGIQNGTEFRVKAAHHFRATFTVPRWGRITGSVSHAELPTVRAYLTNDLDDYDVTVRLAHDGTFVFPQVPNGQFTVCVDGKTSSGKQSDQPCWNGKTNKQVDDDSAYDTMSVPWGHTRSGLDFDLAKP